MHLQQRHLGRLNARVRHRTAKHILLRLAVWCRQACATAILSNSAANNLGDRCALCVLPNTATANGADRLATRITIRSFVKGVRLARDRDEARYCVARHVVAIENHVDTSTQRDLALAALQCTKTSMVGKERRRACCVVRCARALEPQHKRHTTTRDRA
eukprot:1532728-Prymnesium_polylepis.2